MRTRISLAITALCCISPCQTIAGSNSTATTAASAALTQTPSGEAGTPPPPVATGVSETSPQPYPSKGGVAGVPPPPSDLSAANVVSRTVKEIAPGVTWTQEIDSDPPLIINVIAADLDAPGVHAEVGPAQDHVGGTDATGGREDVSRFARRHHVVAAVNGDFFPFTGDPLGIEIHHGELFSEPWTGNGKGGPRVVLGITQDGHQAIVDRLGFIGDLQLPDLSHLRIGGVNRQVGKNEIVVMTPTFAGTKVNRPSGVDAIVTGVDLPLRANKQMTGVVETIHQTVDGVDAIPSNGVILAGGPGTAGPTLLEHMHAGDHVRFALGIGSVEDPSAGVKVADLPRDAGDMPSRSSGAVDRTAWLWSGITEAIGGGPLLLSDGQPALDGAAEGFDPGFVGYTYPRTAVGTSDAGRWLYIVTVDGRQTISQGVSLYQLAAILQRYGATDAINLDGGGSTTMAVDGIVVDSPGGAGTERPVADMLTIAYENATIAMPNWDAAGKLSTQDSPVAGSAQLVSDRDEISVGQTAQIQLESVSSGDSGPTPDATQRQKSIEQPTTDIIWQGPVHRAPQPAAPDSTAAGTPQSAAQTDEHRPADDDGTLVGFVDQTGRFTALRPGTGEITAWYRGEPVTLPITVGEPTSAPSFDTLRAVLLPDASAQSDITAPAVGTSGTAPGYRQILSIHAVKADASPLAGLPVEVTVSGGQVDASEPVTDADGSATIHISWDKPSGGGLVTVSSKGLASVTLGQSD